MEARAKLGIVASAGGSAVIELQPWLTARSIDLVVVTDRACGMEEYCTKNHTTHRRIAYETRDQFSKQAADFFVGEGVNKLVLLIYSRFVGPALYERLPTHNIHPAPLPAFPGLHPLRQQLEAKAPVLGATLHEVDATCDGGPILGQITNSYTVEEAQRLSFLQKTYLALAAIDRTFPSAPQPHRFTNATLPLSDTAYAHFRELETTYNRRILT